MMQKVIDFWFNEIDKSQHWKKDKDFDELIRSRFLDVHNKAIHCELSSWRTSPLGMLAEVIVLDQFSRNIYRDKPKSFAYDSIALALAQSAIAGGHDKELSTHSKSFLYMPFMHSESLVIHEEAVNLFRKTGMESSLNFELKHKTIIEKFGRYPHRNNILGRKSTDEEIAFLTQPGSGF